MNRPLLALLLGLTPLHAEPPRFDLPEGYLAEVIAAPPLVRHPLMAALDDRGRLYVSEAAGVNLNREELEKQLPNSVRRLEDLDGDGIYDRSTVFADKMTFPQGALWLDGSLYVTSPPSIWKLTDDDDDGIADRREVIATGFGFTGNAASLHGPFLHPNGRIFWCHGRKDHEVFQSDGSLLSRGKGARIWSCRPDGSDLEAWAGGGLDNPVEIDFTPEGEIVGSVNLFYGRPRGDVLVHWLRGGKYPRLDQGHILAEFKSTGPILREAHNFGHVAVSGMCIAKGPLFRNPREGEFDVLTSFFNTQEVARTTLTWEGATLVSRRSKILLKVHHPDVHLTDIMEDVDGSLILVDTGGWFRIGCPTSQIAKPEVAGAIYRIRPAGQPTRTNRKPLAKPAAPPPSLPTLLAHLHGNDPRAARRAAEWLGAQREARAIPPLVEALARRPERALEHNLLWALIEIDHFNETQQALARHSDAMPAGLWALDQMASSQLTEEMVLPWCTEGETALAIMRGHPTWREALPQLLRRTLEPLDGTLDPSVTDLVASVAPGLIDHPEMTALVTDLLHGSPSAQALAFRILGELPDRLVPPPTWEQALSSALQSGRPDLLNPRLRALRNLDAPSLHPRMRLLASSETLPLLTRVLALRALAPDGSPSENELALLLQLLGLSSSPHERGEAVGILLGSSLTEPQVLAVAETLPLLSLVEFPSVLQLFARYQSPAVGEALAQAIASSPATASLPVAELERVLDHFPEPSTATARPRLAELRQAAAERSIRLDTLSRHVADQGDPTRGRALFEAGEGACLTCHRIGDHGADFGPNLTTIGRIRQPRDLLESVLFPNASLARDFEAYVIERKEGSPLMGLLRSETTDALTLALPGGASTRIPRREVRSIKPASFSLMPMGLDASLDSLQLLDLVAYLASLR